MIRDDYDAEHLGRPCPSVVPLTTLTSLIEERRQLSAELGSAESNARAARLPETRAKWSAEAARLRVAREKVRARIARQESNR